MTLGFLWTLISHYQVSGVEGQSATEDMKYWLAEKAGIKVSNFSSDWQVSYKKTPKCNWWTSLIFSFR